MKTHINLPKASLDAIAGAVYSLLANNMVLYIKTLHCHWNLEDPRFISLHKLFEEQYEQLAENNDLLAERIRILGRPVEASMKAFLKEADQKEISKSLSGDAMIKELAESHEKAGDAIREAILKIEKLKDAGSVDLLSGILQDHEKSAWFLRSHL